MELTTYTNVLRSSLEKWGRRGLWPILGAGLAGFALSAASLANRAMPIALGLLCAAPPGAYALAIALGGCAGYWLFWQESQGAIWMGLGLLAVALAGDKPIAQQQKLLLPATAALVVSSSGVGFLLWMLDDTAVPIYLLRVLLGAASTAVYRAWRSDPSGAAGWLARCLGTLALAQIAPAGFLNLGFVAAGFFGVRSPFPAAALAGLGLDLAQITPVTMTGVLCLSFCLRLIPNLKGSVSWMGPGLVYLAVSLISGHWSLLPLPALLIGGALGEFLPGNTLTGNVLRRRGPTGIAQVRLEQAANTLDTLQRMLLRGLEPELDKQALLRQAAESACDTCPERKGCKVRGTLALLPTELLERPGLQSSDLPPGCKKSTRLLGELRRSQEQLRRIKAGRAAQRSYRAAVLDQISFLEGFLRSLSDDLCTLRPARPVRFALELGFCSRSLESSSGDCCVSFPGTGSKEYVLLCDGMGTGEEARQAGAETIRLLQQYLCAGFSPAQALRSFNSLCALTARGGWATVDLLEADLITGSGVLYKWGAWPSYLVSGGQLKKVGTAGPPPGLSQLSRETVDRLSLGGGEVLIMLSDGAGEEGLLHHEFLSSGMSAEQMAASILEQGAQRFDDATVAVVRLVPPGLGTQ